MQESYPEWPYKTVDWPLSAPLSQFVLDFGIGQRGRGFRIDGHYAEELRRIRSETGSGRYVPAGALVPREIAIRDASGNLHFAYVRDTLPFERVTDGLVPWPPDSQPSP
jgi:hypothetical protein